MKPHDWRRCEGCGYKTNGFLRRTETREGASLRLCEDCALDEEQLKARDAATQARRVSA